jgi:hypothetical protein
MTSPRDGLIAGPSRPHTVTHTVPDRLTTAPSAPTFPGAAS